MRFLCKISEFLELGGTLMSICRVQNIGQPPRLGTEMRNPRGKSRGDWSSCGQQGGTIVQRGGLGASCKATSLWDSVVRRSFAGAWGDRGQPAHPQESQLLLLLFLITIDSLRSTVGWGHAGRCSGSSLGLWDPLIRSSKPAFFHFGVCPCSSELS